jgi:small subunit ribosomal protein S6
MNQYEVAVLYDPDLEIDLEKATARVEKIFQDNSGKVKNVDNWGKRKLAYPIKKNEYAIYVFYTVEFQSDAIQKVEGVLNITDEVIRFLITRPDLRKLAKAEAVREEKAKKAAERGKAGEINEVEEKEATDDASRKAQQHSQ